VLSADLKGLFHEAERRCGEGARELQDYVRALGGDSERSGTWGGYAHRRWVNLKSAITGMDELAILAERERGEDLAKAAYAMALKTQLPANVKSTIARQYRGVTPSHDRVRGLRNARQTG
jgi:uncharacterized protein (TIGR02284 family)